jgi:L-histidine Nalpha-methyltransferase
MPATTRKPDSRPSGLSSANEATLRDEVRRGLQMHPRQLPSHALYDALGSSLFDAICHLPWYTITRAEQRLLDTYHDDILSRAGWPSLIVELGPGNGDKLARLLRPSREQAAEAPHVAARAVHLVDISPLALAAAAHRLGDLGETQVVTHATQYEMGLREAVAHRRDADARVLTLFLGSNIGNFDPDPARAFLRQLRAAMTPGDVLVIGADLVKPAHTLELAYDDPLGVTAAFNKNMLVRLNRDLGADFDVDAFDHRAVWNARDSRMEMHLVSRTAQRVRVADAGLTFQLSAGEPIWTESSYKYDPDVFMNELTAAQLVPAHHWRDDEGAFLLVLARAT